MTVRHDRGPTNLITIGLDLGNPVDRQHADRAAVLLSRLLLVVGGAGALATLLWPELLNGPEAMKGSARGTALVVLLAGLPAIELGMRAAGRQIPRGRAVWAGGLAYLLYNSVMFCFATPFNALFLVYVAMLGLSAWALIGTLAGTQFSQSWRAFGVRPAGAYLLAVVALNTLAWLGRIVPALGDRSPDFLRGTGLTTNPIFVQDLAFWLPAMTLAGLMLWSGHAWGLLVGGAGLFFWQLEALGVAADQWFAHHADPASPVASTAGVALFAALFFVGAVPTWSVLRRLPGESDEANR